MYYIRKYADCWAIHDDDTGKSRPLTSEETKAVKDEFPELADKKTRSVFTDEITSIKPGL